MIVPFIVLDTECMYIAREMCLPSAATAASVEYQMPMLYVSNILITYITFASENHQVTKLR